jgi:hypothetical protein
MPRHHLHAHHVAAQRVKFKYLRSSLLLIKHHLYRRYLYDKVVMLFKLHRALTMTL